MSHDKFSRTHREFIAKLPPDLVGKYDSIVAMLVVCGVGQKAFLGMMRSPPAGHGYVLLRDAYPIGMAQDLAKDPLTGNSVPTTVPRLGTLHWCALEPIRRLLIKPDYLYEIKSQSQATQDAFFTEYVGIGYAMEQMIAQEQNLVQTATSQDLKSLEQLHDEINKELEDPNNPLRKLIIGGGLK